MKCVVTGAAGFIGSHLCERLLQEGHSVVGLDAFVPSYARSVKEANLVGCLRFPRFLLRELDLSQDPLEDALAGADVLFHLAAMTGLASMKNGVDWYVRWNVIATQRLLNAACSLDCRARVVFASTSSVYGELAVGDETLPTRPVSRYGMTKLAAENLCRDRARACDLPLVILRYFSVYGPRQRPDMGYHRFVRALLADEPVFVHGDGLQVRGNTYISDCVEATVRALEARDGEVYNVGGGETASVWEVLDILEEITGQKADIHRLPPRPGDQRRTRADISKIERHLGWRPHVGLREGLRRQVAWQRQQQHTNRHAPHWFAGNRTGRTDQLFSSIRYAPPDSGNFEE
jgi:nucleoside-diphosphate-sugar epimerase